MKVTFEELAAIYRLANHLAQVDGNLADEEVESMVDFIKDFGLDMETFKKLVSYGLEQMGDREAISLVAGLDAEGKQKVANLFAKVVCSDQDLTDNEKSLYFQISDYCGLPDPETEEAAEEEEEEPEPEAQPAPSREPEQPADEDDEIVPAFLVASYQGIASVRQCEHEDWNNLGPEVASWIHARTVDVVRFTPRLNALTEKLRLNNRHLVFMLSRSSDATLGDNMTGTILYGSGYEIMGDIVFALETDKGYEIEGFRTKSLLNEVFQYVNEAVDGLLRVQ